MSPGILPEVSLEDKDTEELVIPGSGINYGTDVCWGGCVYIF